MTAADHRDAGRVVRVLPDVTGIAKQFDYVVPAAWDLDGRRALIAVGTRVRIELHGRRVGGWIVGVDVEPPSGVDLRSVAKLSGFGPDADLLSLADWIALRWAGSPVRVLRSIAPPRNVTRLPSPHVTQRPAEPTWVDAAFEGVGGILRVPPAGDRWPIVTAAIARGNPLFIGPSVQTASVLARRLKRDGVPVAQLPDDWARAASGAVVAGARAAALARVRDVGAVVVFDEHDESLQDERMPTWHARDVALERARRWQVPCVLVSPTPSLEALARLPLVTMARADEFAGWPAVDVIDRRDEPPGRLGLFSERLVHEVRSDRRIACVLNRKGRARLLACASCGELATCESCESAVRQHDTELACGRCTTTRPVICRSCGATRLKNLLMGVTRAAEELAALVGEPVAEVTATGRTGPPDARVVVGTEAVLHNGRRYDTVVFLDFDQELLAMRQRAAEQALGLLARAARAVGARSGGGKVVIQTRSPDHEVLRAARAGDPSIVADVEASRREAMAWPPFSAQATVSGAAADEFIDRLGSPLGVEVLGPDDGRWLLRSIDHDHLSRAFAEVQRPDGRLRIEVDPLRI